MFSIISDVLQQLNPYEHWYKTIAAVERNILALALLEQRPIPVVTLHMKTGPDRHRYNPPVHDKIAPMFSSLDGTPQLRRGIVVYPRARSIACISYLPQTKSQSNGLPSLLPI